LKETIRQEQRHWIPEGSREQEEMTLMYLQLGLLTRNFLFLQEEVQTVILSKGEEELMAQEGDDQIRKWEMSN